MKSTRSNANRERGDSEVGSAGFTKFVYAVFIINVLAVLLLLFGLLAGWFGISGDRMTDGTYRVGLVFDAQEVGDDIGETMNAASNLTETAKTATGLETYDGIIQRVDAASAQIVLTSEGTDYEVRFTDATEFDDDEINDLSDFKVGDTVRLTVQVKEVATEVAK